MVKPCDKKIPQESTVEQITDVPATGEEILSVPVLVMFEEIVVFPRRATDRDFEEDV